MVAHKLALGASGYGKGPHRDLYIAAWLPKNRLIKLIPPKAAIARFYKLALGASGYGKGPYRDLCIAAWAPKNRLIKLTLPKLL